MNTWVIGVIAAWMSAPAWAASERCADLVADLDRYGATQIVIHLEDARFRVTPRLVRCLERREVPSTVLRAARARIGERSGEAMAIASLELDTARVGWPRDFGGIVARRILQADVGSSPFAVRVRAEESTAPGWYVQRVDEAASALLGSLPKGSRALEDPTVLGRGADLLDQDREAACLRLHNMGFRRVADVWIRGDAEEGVEVEFRVWQTGDLSETVDLLRFGKDGDGEAEPWMNQVRLRTWWGTRAAYPGRRFNFVATLEVADDRVADFRVDGRIGEGEVFSLQSARGPRFVGHPILPASATAQTLLQLRVRAAGLMTAWEPRALPFELPPAVGTVTIRQRLRGARAADGGMFGVAALAGAGSAAAWALSDQARDEANAITDPLAGDMYRARISRAETWGDVGLGSTVVAVSLGVSALVHHVVRTRALRREVLDGGR